MKKAALVLLLLGACVLTFSMSFRKEPVPAELREIAVEPETAAAAEKFARDIQRIAKQKTPREFGRHCADLQDKTLSGSYRALKQYDERGMAVSGITRMAKTPDTCTLTLSNSSGVEALMVCRHTGGEWKFVCFSPSAPCCNNCPGSRGSRRGISSPAAPATYSANSIGGIRRAVADCYLRTTGPGFLRTE